MRPGRIKYEEMAKILDFPLARYEVVLHRARNLLKEKLSEYAKQMGYINLPKSMSNPKKVS